MSLFWQKIAWVVYQLGALVTFVYLLFFERQHDSIFAWVIAFFVSAFNAIIWPIYWVLIVPTAEFLWR